MTYIPYSPDPYIQPKKKNRTMWIVIGTAVVAVVATFAVVLGIGWYLVDGPGATTEAADTTTANPVDEAKKYAADIVSCDNHDKMCHSENWAAIAQLSGAFKPNVPDNIATAVTDFNNQYDSFNSNSRCGVNKMNAVCGIAGLNMNLSASTIKTEVAKLDPNDFEDLDPTSTSIGMFRSLAPQFNTFTDDEVETSAGIVCDQLAAGKTISQTATFVEANSSSGMGRYDIIKFAEAAEQAYCPDGS